MVAYLVGIMAREKRDVICSRKVVADFLDLSVAFPFPPLGPTILEPDLSNTKILGNRNFSGETIALAHRLSSAYSYETKMGNIYDSAACTHT